MTIIKPEMSEESREIWDIVQSLEKRALNRIATNMRPTDDLNIIHQWIWISNLFTCTG